MKKISLLLFVAVLLCAGVFADSELEVEEVNKETVVISEIGNTATYDLVINNLGAEDTFRIFTLVGVTIEPEESFVLMKGKTTIPVRAHFSEKILDERESYLSFEYQIKGNNRELFKDKLPVKIVSIVDALKIEYDDFAPGRESTQIRINNVEDVRIENMTAIFDSAFFRSSFEINLGPHQEKVLEVPIVWEGKEKLVAGPYIVHVTLVTPRGETEAEGFVDFLEEEGLSVSEDTKGIIYRQTTIQKLNKGNTEIAASASMRKDALSRLFTTFSPDPQEVRRDGFFIEYSWQENLNPGETLMVRSTTNYTLPFIVLLIIIAGAVVVRVFYMQAVIVRKRVSLVRTKGGEFALRIIVKVRARKTVEKLELSDSLPPMTKLYEQFGKKPDKIEKDARRLAWSIGHLRQGEERVYSYVIYSKLNVVGQFELPLASATYEKDGAVGRVFSNRAFYAAEKS